MAEGTSPDEPDVARPAAQDPLDRRLDEALDESFPASDPVAVHRIETPQED
jgi:hypothetical protein